MDTSMPTQSHSLSALSKTLSLLTGHRPSVVSSPTSTRRAVFSPPRDSDGRDPASSPSSFSTFVARPGTPFIPSVESSQLLRIPSEICIVLKYLVDFLLKSKLHKNEVFLLEAKPKEQRSLLECIEQGDIPERLSQYSSRSVSYVVLHLLSHGYASLLPSDCYSDLSKLLTCTENGRVEASVACTAFYIQHTLTPEQRGLLESLLLLLHKLSLKQTPRMHAAVLSEMVGAQLMRPAAHDTETTALLSTRHAVGTFLVESAPDIIRLSHDEQHLDHEQVWKARSVLQSDNAISVRPVEPVQALPRYKHVMVAMWVAVWIFKCRRRQQTKPKLSDDGDADANIASVCGVLELVLDQLRTCAPSQLHGLYLHAGDELEVAIVLDKLRGRAFTLSLVCFSLHSVATAVRKVRTMPGDGLC